MHVDRSTRVKPAWKHWVLACVLAVLGGVTVGAVHSDAGGRPRTVFPESTRPYDSAPGQLPPPQEDLDQAPHRPVVRAAATGQPMPRPRAAIRRSELSEPDAVHGNAERGKDGYGKSGRSGRGGRG